MALQKKKANKTQIHIKSLISGPSGSGKTYSALRLAKGITAKDPGDIVMINTEKERGELYGKEFDYYIEDLTDFSPEGYLTKIKEIIAGYEDLKVIIIDSISHGWTWICEQVPKMPGDTQLNWGKMKARNRVLTDFILGADVHILCTGRGKDEYDRKKDDKGKTIIEKVGVGIQADKDVEYEYIVTFNIDRENNIATCMKDNTHLFEGKYEVLTETHGEKLYDWAVSGEESPKPYQIQLIGLAKELGGSADEQVRTAIESNIECKNPADCLSADKLKKAISALEKIKKERSIK